MLAAEEIVRLQDAQTRHWHQGEANADAAPAQSDIETQWMKTVEQQHRANFELWHIEDLARIPEATDEAVARVKRRIDRTNQRRNDLAEKLDSTLLAWLKERELPRPDASLNSESPGLIIDRLSILSLKIYHTREETQRIDTAEGHAQRNRERLAILEEQRKDLACCLDELWNQTLAGKRRFKIYRQLKMYNDPELNPAIYGQATGTKQY